MVRSLVSGRSPTLVALPLALLTAALSATAIELAVGVLAGAAVAVAAGSSRFAPRDPVERGAPTPIGTVADAVPTRGPTGSEPAAVTLLERGLGPLRAASFSGRGGDAGDGPSRDTSGPEDDGPSSEGDGTSDDVIRSAAELTRAEAREVLGVSLTADEAEIRAAYRERVKAVHPDNGGDRAGFMRVTAAYERLTE